MNKDQLWSSISFSWSKRSKKNLQNMKKSSLLHHEYDLLVLLHVNFTQYFTIFQPSLNKYIPVYSCRRGHQKHYQNIKSFTAKCLNPFQILTVTRSGPLCPATSHTSAAAGRESSWSPCSCFTGLDGWCVENKELNTVNQFRKMISSLSSMFPQILLHTLKKRGQFGLRETAGSFREL